MAVERPVTAASYFPLAKNQSTMVTKMRVRDWSEKGTKLSTLKCRMYRCVMKVRPPPRGPHGGDELDVNELACRSGSPC